MPQRRATTLIELVLNERPAPGSHRMSTIATMLAIPSNLLAGLALAGLLLGLWLPRAGLGVASAAVGGLLVTGFSPLANWMLLPLEQRFPAFEENGGPVAGIILLSGALDPSLYKARGGFPVNDAAERFTAFLYLARHYPTARLVVTGGAVAQGRHPLPEADLTAAFLDRMGVPRERLIVEARSRTTAENAGEVAALIGPHPGGRWLLVTSAWHMPRAMGSFRRVGLSVTPYPVDYRTMGPWDRRKSFRKMSTGLDRFDLAAHEWIGLVVYRLTGRSDAVLPGPESDQDPRLAAHP